MAKVPGKGTLLQHGISSVYTTIAQRVSIDGPDASVGSVNVSDLDSAAEEKRPTLPDGGKVSFEIWYDPAGATHQLLTDLHTTPTIEDWKVKWADTGASSCTFTGFVTKFKPGGMKVNEYVNASVEIEISGVVVWPT